MITAGERNELRRIIRQRTKVLRADIDARRAELVVELDRQLKAETAADMKRWDDVQVVIKLAVEEANRRANDVYREFYGTEKWGVTHDRVVVHASTPDSPDGERRVDRREGLRQIEAKVSSAQAELERREVTLLEELAVGSLESAEAKDFMARIPTVAELVPSSRLAEITGGA